MAVETASAHAAYGLRRVVLAMLAGKEGIEKFARIVLGIVGKDAIFRRHDDPARRRHPVSNVQIFAHATGDARYVVSKHICASGALFERSNQATEFVAFCGFSGQIIMEAAEDIDTHSGEQVISRRFLRFPPDLAFVGHARV